MPFKSKTFVDEPVTRSRRARPWEETESEAAWSQKKTKDLEQDEAARADETGKSTALDAAASLKEARSSSPKRWPTLKRAHALSFAGLLLFTAVTYFRPYELFSALSSFKTMAFWLAIATLLAFIPTQLSIEGTLSARPREVNLALLLLLTGLLSVPFAIESSEAWPAFVDFAKVITMFVVMINVVRSEKRLRAMFWLALLVSIVLSVNALNDYRLGNLDPQGHRIVGFIGGLFENPNDLALYFVTMIPLALGLFFVARSFPKKVIYSLCALLMTAALVVTFSRGGFLGLICAMFVMAWKLGRRNRIGVIALFILGGVIFFALVPSDYIGRLLTVFGGSDWHGGSAGARENLLWRSIVVSLRNPVFGVGMNNFRSLSIHDQVSHNAYTQVGAEMGLVALTIYIIFIWAALKRVRIIERETYDSRASARIYYLAVGLQAGLVGYMVSSFFASVAYLWYIYYLVGYALCLHRLYEAKGAEGVFSGTRQSGRLNAPEEPIDPPAVSFIEPLTAHRQ